VVLCGRLKCGIAQFVIKSIQPLTLKQMIDPLAPFAAEMEFFAMLCLFDHDGFVEREITVGTCYICQIRSFNSDEMDFIQKWVKSRMETILLLTSVLMALEVFEAMMQRAETLYGVMQKLYRWYHKSIFLFFLVHPTFYFMLFVVILTKQLNIYIILIISMKIFDLFYKLALLKKIFIQEEITRDMATMLAWKIPVWFFLTGLLLYPPLLYYGLVM